MHGHAELDVVGARRVIVIGKLGRRRPLARGNSSTRDCPRSCARHGRNASLPAMRFVRLLSAAICGALFLSVVACDSKAPVEPIPPVTGSRVVSLSAIPASLFLQLGQEATVAVEARDSTGVLVANAVLTWRSDAPTVATVDASGRVRAVSPGSARITASSGTLATLTQVGVTAAAPGVQQWRVARAGLTDATLLGIWDDGVGTTYGVGQNGTVLRSRVDGVWERLTTNTTETLVGVWGSSPTDIWVVGTAGLILHFDGASFRKVESTTTAALLEVWGLSANDVFASGDQGTILHWDGKLWSQQGTPVTDDLWGIWGANSASVFVVGNNGTILRYNGVSWNRMISASGAPLFDIWGTSTGNIFAVGVSGTILRFDGVLWTTMPTPGTANLFAMTGRTFDDIYAVGNTGATYHFNGTTWSALSIGTGQNLRAVAKRGDGSLRIGGWWGTVVTIRGSGGGVRATTEISDPALLSVWGSTSGAIFGVGLGGAVFQRTDASAGSTWGAAIVPGTNDLYGISGNGPSDIVAVGDTGSILRYDGATWRKDASPTSLLLRAIWGGGGQYVIVGERGTILRSNGAGWTPQASGTPQFLRAVWGSDPTNVYVVGDSGVVLRFDGGRWSPVTVPSRLRFRAVWGTASNNVFIAGDSGTVLRYDGVTWQRQSVPTSRALRSVWGRGPTEIYAAGDSGTVLRYDGSTWRTLSAPSTTILYSMYGVPGTALLAIVGEGARIIEGQP